MESKKNKKTAPAASFSRKEHVRGPTGFLYSSVDLQPDLKIRSAFERGQVLPLSPHRPAEHLIPIALSAVSSKSRPEVCHRVVLTRNLSC